MQEKKLKNITEGYQPLKRGYQASRTPQNKKPPKGGTGLASKNSNGEGDKEKDSSQ